VFHLRSRICEKCEVPVDDESARLLAEYVDGNSDAATEIYNRYVSRLLALVRAKISDKLKPKFGPEDVVQSVYRSFFRKAREDKIVLTRSGDLWRTLSTFAFYKTLKRIEKETQQGNDPDREVRGSVWVNGLIQEGPTAEQVSCVVEQLTLYMQRLSPRDRLILQLRLQGESVAEIVEELKNHTEQLGENVANTQEAVIRRVIREAKRELRAMLFDE